MTLCPLCESPGIAFFDDKRGRVFDACSDVNCGAVFVRPACFLSEAEEAVRYELHDNDITQPGYLKYLDPLLTAIRDNVTEGSSALDFGCGPTQTFARLMDTRYRWRVFDKYFANDDQVWLDRYDLIVASEVLEHFREPAPEIARLAAHLKTGGSLFVMTQLYDAGIDFSRWHYPRDPTHLIFYTRQSFERLARLHDLQLVSVKGHVVHLRKS